MRRKDAPSARNEPEFLAVAAWAWNIADTLLNSDLTLPCLCLGRLQFFLLLFKFHSQGDHFDFILFLQHGLFRHGHVQFLVMPVSTASLLRLTRDLLDQGHTDLKLRKGSRQPP